MYQYDIINREHKLGAIVRQDGIIIQFDSAVWQHGEQRINGVTYWLKHFIPAESFADMIYLNHKLHPDGLGMYRRDNNKRGTKSAWGKVVNAIYQFLNLEHERITQMILQEKYHHLTQRNRILRHEIKSNYSFTDAKMKEKRHELNSNIAIIGVLSRNINNLQLLYDNVLIAKCNYNQLWKKINDFFSTAIDDYHLHNITPKNFWDYSWQRHIIIAENLNSNSKLVIKIMNF